MKINAKESFFAWTELEYPWYIISRKSLHPSQNKVEAIVQIATPTICKQLRCFIGMVNYNREMWPQRSHLLHRYHPWLQEKVKWKWTPVHQEAFDQMKVLIAKETLVTFPYFSKELEVHMDESLTTRGLHFSIEKNCCFLFKKIATSQKPSIKQPNKNYFYSGNTQRSLENTFGQKNQSTYRSQESYVQDL